MHVKIISTMKWSSLLRRAIYSTRSTLDKMERATKRHEDAGTGRQRRRRNIQILGSVRYTQYCNNCH
jgi:hypothetical protein